MGTSKEKLGNPIFIISVLTLFINDWFLKSAFHNFFTGKVSDFAGLFAFPFFLSAMMPKYHKKVHIFTALFFIFWKSEFSQPLINLFNGLNIPIGRTVDLTDCVALIAVYVSHISYQNRSYNGLNINLKPIFVRVLITFSCIVFTATSQVPGENKKYVDIHKKYTFPFSKRELVSRINLIQIHEINSMRLYTGPIDFNSETNTFHFRGSKDTLALMLDYKKLTAQDTIKFRTAITEMTISGNDSTSVLDLLSVYKYTPYRKSKDYREMAIKQFERRIIKKINAYGKYKRDF